MKYWWVIARNWDWLNDQGIGKVERWDALTKNTHPKIRANFKQVRSGDKVIGYNAGTDKAVVAIGCIVRDLYNDDHVVPSIDIIKTNNLPTLIPIEDIRDISPHFNYKFRNIALKTTIIPLSEIDYEYILALGNNVFSDFGDNFAAIIDVINADISVTKVGPKPPPEKFSNTTTTYNRNPNFALEALNKSEYKCELEDLGNSHVTFTSQITGRNFMEAHHLIPMKVQYKFKNSLDVPGDIISLCPNCHKLLHFGESAARKKKVIKLYEKRKTILEQWGIGISLEDLIEIYS